MPKKHIDLTDIDAIAEQYLTMDARHRRERDGIRWRMGDLLAALIDSGKRPSVVYDRFSQATGFSVRYAFELVRVARSVPPARRGEVAWQQARRLSAPDSDAGGTWTLTSSGLHFISHHLGAPDSDAGGEEGNDVRA